jgi:ElaA protein
MTIAWTCKHQEDLGTQQLYAVLALRSEVFVVEQNCPYLDPDGQDLQGDTHHLMAWQDDRLLAYLRLLDPQSQGGDVVIGRVVSAPAARGRGLGNTLLAKGIEAAERLWPGVPIHLSAQAHLQSYYGRQGFVAEGQEYLEDNIPHIGMRKLPQG